MQQQQDLRQQIIQRIAPYANLANLFRNRVPLSPRLHVPVYRNRAVEKAWGRRFTFWNVLLHDADPQFKRLLQELDYLAGKYTSDYGEKLLREGITNNPFSFLSELKVYDTFRANRVMPIIEPRPWPQSKKKLDFSVSLDSRQILIEVIVPLPPEKMLKKAGFGPMDLYVSRNVADEIKSHFRGIYRPTSPVIIAINGLYRALNPINVESALSNLDNRTKLFVSAILLFASNYGPSVAWNPNGPQLTQVEISTLTQIFGLSSATP